jgi:excinuclease UvrABC ATPase subunit
MLFTANGRTVHEFGDMHFDELRPFLDTIKLTGAGAQAGKQVINEIRKRLDLLLGIGLDYLTFNRVSGTLSGGEAQRIRLSTQIGSGLMGMLYVLDELGLGHLTLGQSATTSSGGEAQRVKLATELSKLRRGVIPGAQTRLQVPGSPSSRWIKALPGCSIAAPGSSPAHRRA